jgi:hypothetical protein
MAPMMITFDQVLTNWYALDTASVNFCMIN